MQLLPRYAIFKHTPCNLRGTITFLEVIRIRFATWYFWYNSCSSGSGEQEQVQVAHASSNPSYLFLLPRHKHSQTMHTYSTIQAQLHKSMYYNVKHTYIETYFLGTFKNAQHAFRAYLHSMDSGIGWGNKLNVVCGTNNIILNLYYILQLYKKIN